MNLLNQLYIWLSFQLSIIFFVGVPVSLFCWSLKRKNRAIKTLLSNYWKISLLFFISLVLLMGKYNFALLIMNIALLLMTISVWFWRDINEELKEYKFSNILVSTVKVWRWSLTFISISFIVLGFYNNSCLSFINSQECGIWIEQSTNLFIIFRNLFNFFFGASFTQPVAKFLGLFSMLIYFLGLIQWSIIKLTKNGRHSGFSEYSRN